MEKIELGGTYYTVVATVQNSLYAGDYDWHEGALLNDDEGNLVFISGGGCSCTWLYDGDSAMTPVKTAHEAVKLAKEEFPDSDVYDFAAQLFGPGK